MATVIEMHRRPRKQSGRHVARLDEDQILEIVRLAAQLASASLFAPARAESFRGIVDTLLDGIPDGRWSPALREAFLAASEGTGGA